MKLEGAEKQTQPDVGVWGVCVHHASEGEGEGEGGEEGGGGGGTQGRKWLVLCEVGDDSAGCFFVGKWTEWQRVRARGVSAESFDRDNDDQVKRMSVELCNVCVTAWGELFEGELTGSPEAAWKQAEHPPPSTKERRSKDAHAQKAKESAERAEQLVHYSMTSGDETYAQWHVHRSYTGRPNTIPLENSRSSPSRLAG